MEREGRKFRNPQFLGLLLFTLTSVGTGAVGTTQQSECFNGLKNDYKVKEVTDLPSKVIDDSGCLSPLNTAGLLGTVSGTAGLLYLALRRPREKRESKHVLFPELVHEEPSRE